MPERTSHKPGTPSWIDVISPDQDASAKFYGELFGWECLQEGPEEQTGGYRMFKKNGKYVAGMGRVQEEGMQPFWTTYVTVTDADETAAAVREAGGQVFMEPMDVMTFGRMAVFADPTGAMFAIWQPGDHIGAELVNEPGTLTWNELDTRDPEGAKGFYGKVFGWGAHESEIPGGTYVEWQLNGGFVGGMMDMRHGSFSRDIPPNWLTFFAVDDADATAATARESGGNVIVEPMDTRVGRFAVLADPHGAVFGVIALSVAAG